MHPGCVEYIRDMNVVHVSTRSHLEEVVAALASAKVLGLDFETSGFDPFTDVAWLLSLYDKDCVYVIDVQRCSPEGLWNPNKDLSPLKELLEEKIILGAELKFDLKWLRSFGIRPRKVFDVIVIGRLLTAGKRLPNSLTALCDRNLGFTLDKDTRDSFVMHPEVVKRLRHPPKWTDEQLEYAAMDVYVLKDIRDKQVEELRKVDEVKIGVIENRDVPVVADMEYKGVFVAREPWMEIVEEARVKRRVLYGEACALLATENTQMSLLSDETGSDYAINLDSNPEVKKRFEALGFKLENVDKRSLKGIRHPAAAKIIEYREAVKVDSTYGEDWIGKIHPVTGRVHSSINQLGAESGRFSSNNPNIQNLPADARFRDCFVAPDGYDLIVADYSQIEMRILAEIADDKNLKEVVRAGGDIHSQTASVLFNRPLSECGKGSKYRKFGKTLNFAIVYGLGDKALAEALGLYLEHFDRLMGDYARKMLKRDLSNPGLPEFLKKRYAGLSVQAVEEMDSETLLKVYEVSAPAKSSIEDKAWKVAMDDTKKIKSRYFRTFSGVAKHLEWAQDQPEEIGYSVTMLGRRRYYNPVDPNLPDDERNRQLASMKNQGRNTPIQGSSADMTKIAMFLIADELLRKGLPAELVNCVHDETVTESRHDATEQVAEIVYRNMVAAGRQMITTIPVDVDVTVADRWSKG